MEAEVQALSTPGNASFRKFLTPAQFRSTYSPSPSSVAAVESWVRGAGLTVKSVAPSRLYVEVTGTMGHAESLVGTTLHTYAYQGQDLAEPVSNYTIPAGLSGTVAGVVNLDDSSLLQKPADDRVGTAVPRPTPTADGTLPGPPKGVHYGVQPCSSYYGQTWPPTQPQAYGQSWPYTICGYDADQYEQAFGLYDGIQNGTDGSRCHRGHHRRLCRADHPLGRRHLVDAERSASVRAGQFTQVTPANGYNDE